MNSALFWENHFVCFVSKRRVTGNNCQLPALQLAAAKYEPHDWWLKMVAAKISDSGCELGGCSNACMNCLILKT